MTTIENGSILDLIDEFTAHLTGQDLSPRTVQGYARDVRLFAKWFEGTNGKAATSTASRP